MIPAQQRVRISCSRLLLNSSWLGRMAGEVSRSSSLGGGESTHRDCTVSGHDRPRQVGHHRGKLGALAVSAHVVCPLVLKRDARRRDVAIGSL